MKSKHKHSSVHDGVQFRLWLSLEELATLRSLAKEHGMSQRAVLSALLREARISEMTDGVETEVKVQYVQIPHRIMTDRSLTSYAKLLYMALASATWKRNYQVEISRAKLGERAGIHPNTISSHLRLLVEHDYIRMSKRNKCTVYLLRSPLYGWSEEMDEGYRNGWHTKGGSD